jgi:hypothetical protein
MNCSICNIICIKPDEKYKSSNNIANIRNGSIICNACVAVLDMMGSETKSETKIEKNEVKNKIIITSNSILCPKCKERFSSQICNCGFKNPLFRK